MAKYVKQGQVQAGYTCMEDAVYKTVRDVIQDVAANQDAAVRKLSAQFDQWSPESFRLSEAQIQTIIARVPDRVKDDIRFAQQQVRGFAEKQLATMQDLEVETLPGVILGHKHIPVSSVGCYIPGGRYPMVASAHMSILTAKVAGVRRVMACTPPIKGEIPAATICAMAYAGADEIYVLGGIQAMAAMALGTETIEPVDMLVGPGNAYVAEAKRQLFGKFGIDLIAGPTEVLVIAIIPLIARWWPSTSSGRPSTCRRPRRRSLRPPRRLRERRWSRSRSSC
ncbi:histidinol dehydrogenase [Bacillus sp. 3255]|nr:histidinol dehydrogenase [Bacillus sp. 3255]